MIVPPLHSKATVALEQVIKTCTDDEFKQLVVAVFEERADALINRAEPLGPGRLDYLDRLGVMCTVMMENL